MAVLDLAVKYREQMTYNKYRAARDTIEKFNKEPPYAYEIPREQHDAPTAALLLEKLMLQGIEVHQSTKPDAWVIMMDQPFAGLVKELFEPQVYPALTQRPYDVTGWTLPYQMGVEVHAVTTPLSKQFVDSLRPVKEITGLAAPFNHDRQRQLPRGESRFWPPTARCRSRAMRSALGNLDKVETRCHPDRRIVCARPPPKDAGKPVKPARIGLYRPWTASIDEGWTRWILEQYQVSVHEPLQRRHPRRPSARALRRDRDSRYLRSARLSTATVPAPFPNATPAESARRACRNCAISSTRGGTLVTFNNASMFAINQFKLPVENALAECRRRTSSSVPDAC